MGERDLRRPPPAPDRPRWAVAVLGLALAGLLALALTGGAAVAAAEDQDREGERLITWLLLSPLEAVAPARAEAILGVLALAAAALVAGRTLTARLGGGAPWLVLLLIFGSGAWAVVWSDGGVLVNLALAVAALALAAGDRSGRELLGEIYGSAEPAWRGLLRWLAVGLLLAELVPGAPLLAGLLVPAALAVPAERRGRGLVALAAGWLGGVALELLVWGPEPFLGPLAATAESFRFTPALAGWNLVYLLLGRHVGLLTGFAPLVLLLVLAPGRRALVATCLVLAVAGVLVAPFDFAGGWLHLGFLPLYGALWTAAERLPRRGEWLAITLLAGLLTWPLWWPPGPAAAAERLGNAWPRRYLPYETTLRELPERGESARGRADLRLRAVRGCRMLDDSGRIELDGRGPAELWLAVPPALEMAALEFGPGAASSLEARGAGVGRTVFRPDGRIGFELLLERPRARHPLWFGDGEFAVHLVSVAMPGYSGELPLRFRLLAPQPGAGGERNN